MTQRMNADPWHARPGAGPVKDIEIRMPVDTFCGTRGETNARAFDVHGYPFLAWKP